MVYTIYETNCIIFDIKNIQENDCLIKAFSDKFGIINIIATSFRKESSKLKGNIKAYSLNRVALVKGKEFFRLTDVNHKFSFSGSKSLVGFLRMAEGLFFNDENEYFDEINVDIYNMIIHLCRFITYIIKSDLPDKKYFIDLTAVFFNVYIKGVQGFTHKINTSEMLKMQEKSLHDWFLREKDNINSLKSVLN